METMSKSEMKTAMINYLKSSKTEMSEIIITAIVDISTLIISSGAMKTRNMLMEDGKPDTILSMREWIKTMDHSYTLESPMVQEYLHPLTLEEETEVFDFLNNMSTTPSELEVSALKLLFGYTSEEEHFSLVDSSSEEMLSGVINTYFRVK